MWVDLLGIAYPLGLFKQTTCSTHSNQENFKLKSKNLIIKVTVYVKNKAAVKIDMV